MSDLFYAQLNHATQGKWTFCFLVLTQHLVNTVIELAICNQKYA